MATAQATPTQHNNPTQLTAKGAKQWIPARHSATIFHAGCSDIGPCLGDQQVSHIRRLHHRCEIGLVRADGRGHALVTQYVPGTMHRHDR